jgi:hypothetical protein
MKIALILVIATLVGATGAYASTIDLGFFAVSPQGSFLYNSPTDNCASYAQAVAGCNNSPTFINLSAYVGDTITVTDVGGLCVYSGANCTVYPASASYLGGVFSTQGVSSLSGPSNIIRLPDEVSSGLPNINNNPNLNSLIGGVNTTIPDDFYLPVTNLVVAADWLVVGTLDSFFSDNSLGTCNPNTTECFGVDITVNVSSTPEPGSAALLVTGIAGLWFFRRKFATKA